MSDILTVLTSRGPVMAKTWQADGSIKAYDSAKYFETQEVKVDSIERLSYVLTKLEAKPRSCVIRGKYRGEEWSLAHANGDHKPGLALRQIDLHEDIPHQWVLIEVDNFEPISADPVTDPVCAIDEYIAAHLPAEFGNASYHWQLSNSAGHTKHAGKLKAHLWFWLARSYTSAQLKAWAKAFEIQTDTAVFNAIQVHYTAAPIFDGVEDPIPRRSGLVRRPDQSVDILIPDVLPMLKDSRREVLENAYQNDPIAVALFERGMVKSLGRKGELFIACPRAEHHTGENGATDTAYFPANTGGYATGNFKCLHSHCTDEPQQSFREALGLADGFDDLRADHQNSSITVNASPTEPQKFQPVSFADFATFPQGARYHVKHILPVCDLAVIFGPSGSGKSFAAMDLALAVAQGLPWRGYKTTKGRVVYVVAEGARGARLRAMAYAKHHGIDPADIDMLILADQPNLMKADDVRALLKALKQCGQIALVVIDTFAQTTPGANENSGEDMGKALGHCRTIAAVLQTTVLLIHHSGKDESRGARGWSGIRAAVDVELEVSRDDDDRCLSVTKQKDGEEGLLLGFKLLTVPLGVDADGEPITSCVVEHTDGSVTKKRVAKLGINEKAILDVLDELQSLDDSRVTVEMLVAAACKRLQEPANGARDRRRDVVRRALEELQKNARLVIADGFVRAS